MADYTPPTSSGIIFRFTSSGYTAPIFDDVEFQFTAQASSTSNMAASIQVMQLYQDETYTYTKECPTYTIASPTGIQVITLPCSYGGIRDLGAYIYGNPPNVDLGAYIFGFDTYSDTKDLSAYIKSTIQATSNLGAYAKSSVGGYKDIVAAIRRLDNSSKDLEASLHGWATFDLQASIGAHPPADLQAILNVIEIRDLAAEITGVLFGGSTDLGAVVHKIFQISHSNLGAYIRSNWVVVDLPASLNIISLCDLPVVIKPLIAGYSDLGAYLKAKELKNLSAFIHGYDERFLTASINGVYGPYDLQAYLRVHPYLSLPATIHGWYSGTWDLRAYVEGFYKADLIAYINAIEATNLGAVINATGKATDLSAYIIPSVVRLKQAIQVVLLEHKNLKALINFQCVSSAYANLGVTFGTVFKKLDLPTFIWGWKTADKYGELKAYINTAIYSVEDKFIPKFVPAIRPYTQLRLKFSAFGDYRVFDTQPIFYGSYYVKTLGAYIYAMPRAVDLGAYIEPVLQTNYTELPDYINPKSNVVVIKFNDKWQEEWRRFVEIMFKKDGPAPYHYFYVSGTNKIYKIDRSRHWTIWATSYEKDETTMFDRANVRTKFIFNMSKYSKIDEALRDLIDRVSAYRESNMAASITCVGGRNYDLGAYIIPNGNPKRRWAKYLGASITAI